MLGDVALPLLVGPVCQVGRSVLLEAAIDALEGLWPPFPRPPM